MAKSEYSTEHIKEVWPDADDLIRLAMPGIDQLDLVHRMTRVRLMFRRAFRRLWAQWVIVTCQQRDCRDCPQVVGCITGHW